jgi:hypothetical protein
MARREGVLENLQDTRIKNVAQSWQLVQCSVTSKAWMLANSRA